MHGRRFLLFICMMLGVNLTAQEIDNTALYRSPGSEKAVRLFYENDLFAKSDEDYSQGISFELNHPFFLKSPVTRILLKTKSVTRTGISLEHDAYTPSYLDTSGILRNDRPYAATLSVRSFRISEDTLRKFRLVSSFTLGVIGPAAGGKEIQTGIHKAINGIRPLGWGNQISNDLLVNYRVDAQKSLFTITSRFLIAANASVVVGSPYTGVNAGFAIMAGHFNSPFFKQAVIGKVRIYVYFQPVVSYLLYDATLQGGLFSRSSVYVVSQNQLHELRSLNTAGLVLEFGKLRLEGSFSARSNGNRNSAAHCWGGIHVGINF